MHATDKCVWQMSVYMYGWEIPQENETVLNMHLYNGVTTGVRRHYAKIWPGGSLGAMLWGLVALVCARLRLSPHTHLCFIRGDSVRQGDCGRIHPPPEIMYKSVPQCSIYTPISCLRFLLNQRKSCPACRSWYCLYLFVLSSPSRSFSFLYGMTEWWFILNIMGRNTDELSIPLCLNESRRTQVRQGYYINKEKKWTVQRPIVLSRPSRLYLITVDYITEIFSLFLKENILQILLEVC